MTKFFGLAAVVIVGSLNVTVVNPAHAAARTPSPQSIVDQAVSNGVPGIAAVVTDESGTTIAAAGQDTGVPITANTLFRIESLSKSFTATAVMQLVERGTVDLDRPAVEYLPGLRIDDDRTGQITVRQLLGQSSGLTDATLGFNQYRGGPTTLKQAVARLENSTLAFDPGTDWAYSNPNYWVAARLVERVSGERFAQYLRHHIFSPLGMTHTRDVSTSGRSAISSGDATPSNVYAFGLPVAVTGPDFFVDGAGGVITTAPDMARWVRFNQGQDVGQGSAADHVLSHASLHELHRRQAPHDGLYALGWYSGPPADGGVPRVSHSGVGAGVGAYQGLFPGGVSIVVLQAASVPDPYAIAEALYNARTGHGPVDPPSAPPAWPDAIVAVLTLCIVGLCVRTVRRSLRRCGVAARPRWARVARRVAAATSMALGLMLALAPSWGSRLVGRTATWTVLFYNAPVIVVCAVVLATALVATPLVVACAAAQSYPAHCRTNRTFRSKPGAISG